MGRFITPAVQATTLGQRSLYFEQPRPGEVRQIQDVIIQAISGLGSSAMMSLTKQPEGQFFSAGAGANNPLAVGIYQLFNPVLWHSGEGVFLTPPASGLVPDGPDQPLGSAPVTQNPAVSMTVAAPVAAGELVVVIAWSTLPPPGGDLAVSDSERNTYTRITSITSGDYNALFASQITNSLSPGDTITVAGGAGSTSNVSLAAYSAGQITTPAYGVNAKTAGASAATISTSTPVNAGDLVVAMIADSNGSMPGGWTVFPNSMTGSAAIAGLRLAPSTAVQTFAPGGTSSYRGVIAAWPAGSVSFDLLVALGCQQ